MISKAKLPAWALLAVFFAQGLLLIGRTSPTTDETAFHMVNGYTYWKTRDYRMSPANPALIREWMALPWFVLNPKLNLDKESWRQADSVPFSSDFFYKDNRADADRLLYSARFMILLLAVWLGWMIYAWAGRLYGPSGGLASLAFYVFCPVFLGHSAIAHTDVGITAFLFASAFALWRYLETPTARERWVFCVFYGLAAAAKFHALYFGPIFLAVLLMRRGAREAWAMAWRLSLVSLGVIWASYLFDTQPLLAGGVPRVEEKLSLMPEGLRWAALHLPIPAPSYWLGILGIVRSHQAPYTHYAFGEWTTQPRWYFYFFSFAVKMTLPFLAALLARSIFWKKIPFNANAALVIWVPAVLWFAALCKDSTGVGVRYLFPVIPLLIVWAGGLAAASGKALRIFCATLAAWGAVECLAVFPNNLAYFNELVGANGYRYVRGSDVDWGQGLKELKRYLDKRGIRDISLLYFGTADPSFYGLSYKTLSDAEYQIPEPRLYAISLFYLEHPQWTKNHPPQAIVGGAIAIYDFRK